jgi:hypothetical protein
MSNSQERAAPHRNNIQELAILRCLGVLWRRKVLILCGSLLPTLVVGVLLHTLPARYKVTVVYERPLTESSYSVLLRRFYSSENLGKIIDQLKERRMQGYAEKLEEAETEQALEKLIRFSVTPAYPKRLQTTDPATSERISSFEAQLLYVDIVGESKGEVSAVSAVVTADLENILPAYEIRNALKESIQDFKKLAAEIEDSRFTMTLDLEKEKEKLSKLQGLDSAPMPATEGNVVLQFTDVQESREFLPLSYQVRAVRSKIIDLEETLAGNQEKYAYYLKILALNDRLLKEIEDRILTYYTVEQFLGFLGERLLECQDDALADYLKSYIRKTQNLMLVNTRAGETPVVYPIAKHVAGHSVLTFVVSLMVMTFVAAVLEYGRVRPVAGR